GLAVVVTQDCDLEWDFNARQQPPTAGHDKLLYEVLMCGVHEEDRFLSGQYRDGAVPLAKKQSPWSIVRQNREPRFQYLGCLPFGSSQPTNVVADFKDFFSVPCEYLYKMLTAEAPAVKRVASLREVYREHLLQRFGWFLTRIGLQKDFHELVGGAAASGSTSPGR
ncbi:MAG: hypothetical protein QME96_17715, partial [Myxococcota bacterium]|nr:hypothetical protein [Myxococcota bacterium]